MYDLMVDPRDLFPGCYVIYELLGWEVTGVTTEGVRLWRRSRKVKTADPDDLFGLPVTPHVMDVVGWYRDPVPNGIRYNETQGPDTWVVKFWLEKTDLGEVIYLPGEITFGKPIRNGDRKIKDIHELQQQYRWATGQHLTIKL